MGSSSSEEEEEEKELGGGGVVVVHLTERAVAERQRAGAARAAAKALGSRIGEVIYPTQEEEEAAAAEAAAAAAAAADPPLVWFGKYGSGGRGGGVRLPRLCEEIGRRSRDERLERRRGSGDRQLHSGRSGDDATATAAAAAAEGAKAADAEVGLALFTRLFCSQNTT